MWKDETILTIMKNLFVLAALALLMSSCVVTKDQTNLEDNYSAYKSAIEYESMHHLLHEVLKIENLEKHTVHTNDLYTRADTWGGSMFRLMAYNYNGTTGVVCSSFSTFDMNENGTYNFNNVHLPINDLTKMNDFYTGQEDLKHSEHRVMRLNENITLEVTKAYNSERYAIWTNRFSRMTMTPSAWAKFYSEMDEIISRK